MELLDGFDSNRISHDQLEKNCPPEALIAMGPKNMNDQLALHNIPRYTYHHFSKNVQTMFLLMLRIIYIHIIYYIYIYHACTDPICFFLPICQRRPVAGHVNGMSMGYSPNVAMSYHWDSIGIMMIDIV